MGLWVWLGRWMKADGKEAQLPWRMFWVGLAVRVAYMTLAHTYRLRVLLDHFEFGWEMGRIARALATGYGYADPFNGHSGATAWTAPLFPLLLAGVFKVFGVYTLVSAWVILAINSAFSAGIAPAVWEIGWRCFGRGGEGRKIALWAGWLWVLYPAAMQYGVKWVWEMSLTAFLFSWVIVLALRIRGIGGSPRQTAGAWALFGAVWGLIALSNSSLVMFLPACGLWMGWEALRRKARRGVTVRHTLLASVCFLGVLTPWVVRNWYALHGFVPLRGNLGAELFESAREPNHGFPWGTTLPLADSAPELQRYVRLGELEYSRQQGKHAKVLIQANPRRFAGYTMLRIDMFWVSVPHSAEKGVLLEAGREMNFCFLSISGWLGVGLALRRGVPGAWLFLWAFLLLPAVYYVITVQARFRHPLEPLICLLTVYLFRSADRTRAFSWQRRVAA